MTDAEKIMLKGALEVLPEGYAIVPVKPTRRMMEQAGFNLSAEFGVEKALGLKDFVEAAWDELVGAGRIR